MSIVAEGAFQGKPVLGICNGCQILAETGLIAGVSTDTVEVGMAPNTRDSRPVGFICDWRYVTVTNPSAGIFTRHFNDGDVLPIPINHGEGRFVLSVPHRNVCPSWRHSDIVHPKDLKPVSFLKIRTGHMKIWPGFVVKTETCWELCRIPKEVHF